MTPSTIGTLFAVAAALAMTPLLPAQPELPPVTECLASHVERNEIAGAVALVVQDGKVVHQGAVGRSNLATGRAQQVDDLFWIASMTKPITAAAVLVLADEGKLSIDDPVEKYLPEFKNPWQVEEKTDDRMVLKRPATTVTLRHLLTHTSGIGELPAPAEGTPLAEWVTTSARLPLLFEPGTQWRYSNTGINALGRVVEVVAQQPFEQILQQRFFDPLGMTETTFFPSADQAGRLSVSYKLDTDTGTLEPTQTAFIRGPVTSRDRTIAPAGGLFSTAQDIARFYGMLLNRGVGPDGKRYLSEAMIDAMTRTQTGDISKAGHTEGMTFGLGVGVLREPVGRNAMLSPGTFGHGGAFGTQVWADPKRRLLMVLMVQRANLKPHADASELRREFLDSVMRSIEQ